MTKSALRAVLALIAVCAAVAIAADPPPALGPAPTPAPAPASAADTSVRPALPATTSAPQVPALAPEPSERELLRRARLAKREALLLEREQIRAERLERREVMRASRDSARRLDNFYLGAGLVTSQYSAFSGSDSEATETSAPVGIWFGYRTHFARLFGFRVGGLAHFGSTEVERGVEDPIFPSGYPYQATGSGGMTGEIDASVQMILGPFGRFAIEPGFFYGYGWHTARTIRMGNDGVNDVSYNPRPRFSVAGMMLGTSLFLGSRDQFCPTGQLSFGKALGTADAAVFTAGLGFTFAFQDG